MTYRLALVTLVCSMLWAGGATAQIIAVMPMEDLSQGANGVDLDLTSRLEEGLRNRGLEVVSQEAVLSFMARNRVRWLGFLNTYHILQLRRELGAQFILLGTVTQRAETPVPSLGMALTLVRAEDSRTIWTGVASLSASDVCNLLGVDEPRSTEELLPAVAGRILAGWPANTDLEMTQTPLFELAGVEIRPRYAQPGNKVTCAVRLRPSLDGQTPDVALKVQDILYLPMRNVMGSTYEAAWPASSQEGRYPVTLLLRWPSGKERTAFVGTYTVDDSPPALSLGLKGVRLGGAVAFRDRVFLVPQLEEREPVRRWEFLVEDSAGNTILRAEDEGRLPARFVWKGQGKEGMRVRDGNYRVVLKIWDRAENLAVATEMVAAKRTPPDMILEARRRGEQTILDLRNRGEVPLAFWRLEMRAGDGGLVKAAEGQDLTTAVDVAVPEKAVECILTAMDVLGNQLRRQIKDLKILAKQQEDTRDPAASNWLVEF